MAATSTPRIPISAVSDSFTYVVTDAGSGETSTQSVTPDGMDAVRRFSRLADDQNAGDDQDTVISGSVAEQRHDPCRAARSLTPIEIGVENGALTFNADGALRTTHRVQALTAPILLVTW